MSDDTSDHPLSQSTIQRPSFESAYGTSPISAGSGSGGGGAAVVISSSSRDNNPVKDFLGDAYDRFKPKNAKNLSLSDAAIDAEGLQKLSENGQWKAVLALCERGFQATHLPPDQILQFRLSHLVALLRLRLYEFANAQCDSLGNLQKGVNYFYQSYPAVYKQREGNFVPFSLEIIKALVPHFRGNTKKALDQLYRLLFRCSQEMQKIDPANAHEYGILRPSRRVLAMKSATQLHHHRAAVAAAAAAEQKKEDSRAKKTQSQGATDGEDGSEDAEQNIGILAEAIDASEQRIRHRQPSHLHVQLSEQQREQLALWKLREQRLLFFIVNCHIAQQEYRLACQLIEKALDHYQRDETLLSLLGSLYLQVGMIQHATKIFDEVDALVLSTGRSIDDNVRCMLNRGALHFAEGSFELAYLKFNAVLSGPDPTNVVAANNRAICLLYQRQLCEAISSLEEVIKRDPPKMLDETLVYNLCTLYDLANENSISKKRVIRAMVMRFCGDDFNQASIKMM